MPLEPPQLDTRTYDELVAELRRRIPRYAPEWTDFNESDPGMTLVELFAWLTETLLYQLNRVPDRNLLTFLKLLDLELRPALPARADLVFTPRAGAAVEPVPKGARISAPPAAGGDALIFETERGIGVTPVPLTDVQVFDGSVFTVKTDEDAKPGLSYAPLGVPARLGSALYLGFTPAQGGAPAAFPEELRFRVFRALAAGEEQPQRCDAAAPPAPAVRLAWEYLPRANARWRRLELFGDESAAFTREGYISVAGPGELEPVAQLGKLQDARFWLRARLEAGSYPAGTPPQIDFIRVNATPAQNLATVRDELVGVSDGRPGQRLRLQHAPVVEDTLELEVEPSAAGASAGDKVWKRVDNFLASGPSERVYTLNRNSGELGFGDGKRGAIPLADSDIVARSYRYGGGLGGNVEAGQIATPVTTLVGIESVTNPRAAVGGQDEEPLDDLKLRAPGVLRRRDAAISAPDFADLAAQVGGVRRATAVALAHPGHPGVEVPGAVSVVIVPEAAEPAPQPPPDLTRAVCAHLDEHRLLTTELYVGGPRYVSLALTARVAAAPYAAPDEVERGIQQRLRDALDPGRRPFGLDLHPTSLYGVILGDGSAGVVSVDALELWVDNQPHELTRAVVVSPDGLVVLGEADITVLPAVDR